MIADERRQLAELARTLSDDQLRLPSLVPTWTVKDVLAHLCLGFAVSGPRFLLALVTTGSFEKAADKLTWELSKRPTAELIDLLLRNAEHRFTPPGAGPEAPLTEVLVHGLDLRWPVGVQRAIPEERARIALGMLFESPARGFIRRRWRDGLRFEATDLAWSSGSGPLLRGPSQAVMLAVTGRTASLEKLEGDGVAVLRQRYGVS